MRATIGSAFDGITYQKGAAVIRMFENYVGPGEVSERDPDYMLKACVGSSHRARFP